MVIRRCALLALSALESLTQVRNRRSMHRRRQSRWYRDFLELLRRGQLRFRYSYESRMRCTMQCPASSGVAVACEMRDGEIHKSARDRLAYMTKGRRRCWLGMGGGGGVRGYGVGLGSISDARVGDSRFDGRDG